MKAVEVIDIYRGLEERGLKIWIDGGWAVDALLGVQTRDHQDLDLAVERSDMYSLKEYFRDLGFSEIQRDEDKMWDMVLIDKRGREIEVHAFDLDTHGNIVIQNYWNGYSTDSLGGIGKIEGYKVRCVSLDQIVKTHNKTKRTLKETDVLDMKALKDRFSVVFPE